MPLSFRRSYKKHPTTDLDRNKRRIAGTPDKKPGVEVPPEFRPRRYPVILPIGCAVAAGLCIFFLSTQGLMQLRSTPTATPQDMAAISTTAVETAVAGRSTSQGTPSPSVTPSPVPTHTLILVPTEPVLAANPWAAEIPNAACIPADLPQTGRVVEVLDGDTIKVLMDADGRVYSVRYLGVDAPELRGGSAGLGPQAMAMNTQLTYRKQALLVRDLTDSDASGTLLRYVLADGVFVNDALIQNGLGQVRLGAPDTACLQTLLASQLEAQSQGRGIWGSALTPAATP